VEEALERTKKIWLQIPERKQLAAKLTKTKAVQDLGLFFEIKTTTGKNRTHTIVKPGAIKEKLRDLTRVGVQPEKAAKTKPVESLKGTPAETEQPKIIHATMQQKAEILDLLKSAVVSEKEKAKILSNINELDTNRAAGIISELKSTVLIWMEPTALLKEPPNQKPFAAAS
jgi:hypothetical protein